jgi:hypothetical protein
MPTFFSKGLRKKGQKPVRITGIPAENQTDHLLNKSEERYGYANPLSTSLSLALV